MKTKAAKAIINHVWPQSFTYGGTATVPFQLINDLYKAIWSVDPKWYPGKVETKKRA